MKKVFMFLVVIIIIVLSFLVPNVLLKMEDFKIESISYKEKRSNSKIDVHAENIYLVKAIHDIENRKV